ncbi:MAG: NUDIX hydrolase [Caldilineaceae bacterium]|nr:NUDIX hydrolase [Caldilineaceae bacterium]
MTRIGPIRRRMVEEDEVSQLEQRYGSAVRSTYTLQADDYIRRYRWRPDSDRRAEVVFAIQDPAERIWLHAKAHYPAHIYRALSGGVHWDEAVETALFREVKEETSLECSIERFLGLLIYKFHFQEETAEFASYVFHLRADFSQPVCVRDNEISAFRAVLPRQLSDVSNDLRNLIGDRRVWGQWRALSVDLIYRQLVDENIQEQGAGEL